MSNDGEHNEAAVRLDRATHEQVVPDSQAFVRMSTPTLTDFLLARIAEDAEWALREPRCECSVHEPGCAPRILDECEAKRRIVDKVYDVRGVAGIHLDEVLRLLALPYADHPDYRDEWRP